jgi:Kef-type K+ transport system membrane component KefB
MDWQAIDWRHATPYLVPVLVVALMARRLIRNAPRRVKVNRMFILPLIAAVGTVATLAATPMPALIWIAGFAVAAALGAGVGFLTTHHQEFSLNTDTGEITSKATPIGTILIVPLFALRFGLKLAFPQLGGAGYGPPHAHPGGDVIAWTDAGLIFSTAMLMARVATTWLRTRPLIAEHRAAQPPPAS